jgi:hypothetical protein
MLRYVRRTSHWFSRQAIMGSPGDREFRETLRAGCQKFIAKIRKDRITHKDVKNEGRSDYVYENKG